MRLYILNDVTNEPIFNELYKSRIKLFVYIVAMYYYNIKKISYMITYRNI